MKMFSENNRISVRQAVRNYGMMVISISALVIPPCHLYCWQQGCWESILQEWLRLQHRKIEYSGLHHMYMAGYWGH